MCEGHDHTHDHTVEVDIPVMKANDAIAHQNQHFFEKRGIIAINIMGSPGSGKTTLIENIASGLGKVAVIQGDLESDIDKERLEKAGIPTYQINTHSGCHLNAKMINDALMDMNLDGVKYLLIENVGNLVCPADVKLGHGMNLVVSSVTEGSDKPAKYPIIFRDADAIILSKTDLASYVDFDEKSYVKDLQKITKAEVIRVTKKDKGSWKAVVDKLLTFKPRPHHH